MEYTGDFTNEDIFDIDVDRLLKFHIFRKTVHDRLNYKAAKKTNIFLNVKLHY